MYLMSLMITRPDEVVDYKTSMTTYQDPLREFGGS